MHYVGTAACRKGLRANVRHNSISELSSVRPLVGLTELWIQSNKVAVNRYTRVRTHAGMHTRVRAHTPRATRTHAQHAHLVRRWRICNSCMSLALCRCCKSWCAHSATVNSIISAEVPPPSKQACVRMFGGVWARVGLAAVVLEMQPPVPACNATRAVRTQRSMCRAVSA